MYVRTYVCMYIYIYRQYVCEYTNGPTTFVVLNHPNLGASNCEPIVSQL